MENEMGMCRPAASVLGVGSVSCDRCPFPFCVVAEAEVIQVELKKRLASVMQGLGNSMNEIAREVGRSARSISRYTKVQQKTDCAWCDLVHSQDVMCKSNIYTVACGGRQYTVTLNRHRHATQHELSVVRYFIDYVFPSSSVSRFGDIHDYWLVDKVGLEEAQSFECMCDALNRYTLGLGRSAVCLQV